MASGAESRMARFGKAGGMRNMATFGSLDENRHGQIQLYFPHEHIQRSRQFDWAAKVDAYRRVGSAGRPAICLTISCRRVMRSGWRLC